MPAGWPMARLHPTVICVGFVIHDATPRSSTVVGQPRPPATLIVPRMASPRSPPERSPSLSPHVPAIARPAPASRRSARRPGRPRGECRPRDGWRRSASATRSRTSLWLPAGALQRRRSACRPDSAHVRRVGSADARLLGEPGAATASSRSSRRAHAKADDRRRAAFEAHRFASYLHHLGLGRAKTIKHWPGPDELLLR